MSILPRVIHGKFEIGGMTAGSEAIKIPALVQKAGILFFSKGDVSRRSTEAQWCSQPSGHAGRKGCMASEPGTGVRALTMCGEGFGAILRLFDKI